MPIYTYICSSGHKTDALVGMAKRDRPNLRCRKCDRPLVRTVALPAPARGNFNTPPRKDVK